MKSAQFLVALLLFAGCKGGGATGPSEIPATDLVGVWTINVEASPGCWLAGPSWFRLVPSDAASVSTCSPSGCSGTGVGGAAGSHFFNVVSSVWSWSASFASSLPVTGSINITERRGVLSLWKTYPARAELNFTIASATSITGTFADVNHAFAFADGCTAAFTATKP